MTPSELKKHVEARGGLFFTRNNMKFAGDTMSNFGCYSATVPIKKLDENGEFVAKETEVWVLYRKKPVKHGVSHSFYFDKKDYSYRVAV